MNLPTTFESALQHHEDAVARIQAKQLRSKAQAEFVPLPAMEWSYYIRLTGPARTSIRPTAQEKGNAQEYVQRVFGQIERVLLIAKSGARTSSETIECAPPPGLEEFLRAKVEVREQEEGEQAAGEVEPLAGMRPRPDQRGR